MDSKLQQAIVATRAGYNETAQILLTDVLQENPEDTGAWFLLAHLVQSTERQARYLQYTLFLEPDHELASQHLEQLRNPGVPPPVIKVYSDHGVTSPLATPPPSVQSEFSPIQPAKTSSALSVSSTPELSYESLPSGSSQVAGEQNSRRIDADWQKTAPPPKRASQPAPVLPVQRSTAPTTAVNTETIPETKREPVNKWLLAIFLILVAVAAFILSYLAYTIFIQ